MDDAQKKMEKGTWEVTHNNKTRCFLWKLRGWGDACCGGSGKCPIAIWDCGTSTIWAMQDEDGSGRRLIYRSSLSHSGLRGCRAEHHGTCSPQRLKTHLRLKAWRIIIKKSFEEEKRRLQEDTVGCWSIDGHKGVIRCEGFTPGGSASAFCSAAAIKGKQKGRKISAAALSTRNAAFHRPNLSKATAEEINTGVFFMCVCVKLQYSAASGELA